MLWLPVVQGAADLVWIPVLEGAADLVCAVVNKAISRPHPSVGSAQYTLYGICADIRILCHPWLLTLAASRKDGRDREDGPTWSEGGKGRGAERGVGFSDCARAPCL